MKKGAAPVLLIVLGVIIILGVYALTVLNSDCRTNKQCDQGEYCGSDRKCHAYPSEVIVKESNYLPAAIVLAGGMVSYALLRREKPILLRR